MPNFSLVAGALLWLGISLCVIQPQIAGAQTPPTAKASSPSPRLRPPPPSPPLPVAPFQRVPLSAIDLTTRASICALPDGGDCVGTLSWLIDLPPFPLTSGQRGQGLQCVGGNATILGCKWRTLEAYWGDGQPDTFLFRPLELVIDSPDVSQAFLLGHTFLGGHLLRQLESLSISCTDPVPVYAPHLLEPLIMAIAGAGVDAGANASSGSPSPSPSPSRPPPNGTFSPAPAPPLPSPPSPPSPPPSPPVAALTSVLAGAGGAPHEALPAAAPFNFTYTQVLNANDTASYFSRLYMPPQGAEPRLRRLKINYCELAGQMPGQATWLVLPNLEQLDLSHNSLSGSLPATFGPAGDGSILYLNLSHNRISGPLLPTMTRYGGCGRIVDLSYNDIRGPLPSSWVEGSCSLDGKDSNGLTPRLTDASQNWTATTVNYSASPSNFTRIYAAINAALATMSGSGPFWMTYTSQYAFMSDECGFDGVAWDLDHAVNVRMDRGDGKTFPYGILLYGNPRLTPPRGSAYAVAASRGLRFSIHRNACTSFYPLPDLLWLWGSYGAAAIALLLASAIHGLMQLRDTKTKVAPEGDAGQNGSTGGALACTASTTPSSSPPPASQAVTPRPAPPPAAAGAVAEATAALPGAPDPAAASDGEPLLPRPDPSTPGPAASPSAGASAGGAASTPASGGGASLAQSSVGNASGAGSTNGMAKIIVVAHARSYSREAVQRLSVYGGAVAEAWSASIMWLFNEVPWGPIVRCVIATAVHLGAIGLVFALTRPRRLEYCQIEYISCLPRVYIFPIVCGALAIGLTLFLMRATQQLAGTMSVQLVGQAVRAAQQRLASSGGGSGGGGPGDEDNANSEEALEAKLAQVAGKKGPAGGGSAAPEIRVSSGGSVTASASGGGSSGSGNDRIRAAMAPADASASGPPRRQPTGEAAEDWSYPSAAPAYDVRALNASPSRGRFSSRSLGGASVMPVPVRTMLQRPSAAQSPGPHSGAGSPSGGAPGHGFGSAADTPRAAAAVPPASPGNSYPASGGASGGPVSPASAGGSGGGAQFRSPAGGASYGRPVAEAGEAPAELVQVLPHPPPAPPPPPAAAPPPPTRTTEGGAPGRQWTSQAAVFSPARAASEGGVGSLASHPPYLPPAGMTRVPSSLGPTAVGPRTGAGLDGCRMAGSGEVAQAAESGWDRNDPHGWWSPGDAAAAPGPLAEALEGSPSSRRQTDGSPASPGAASPARHQGSGGSGGGARGSGPGADTPTRHSTPPPLRKASSAARGATGLAAPPPAPSPTARQSPPGAARTGGGTQASPDSTANPDAQADAGDQSQLVRSSTRPSRRNLAGPTCSHESRRVRSPSRLTSRSGVGTPETSAATTAGGAVSDAGAILGPARNSISRGGGGGGGGPTRATDGGVPSTGLPALTASRRGMSMGADRTLDRAPSAATRAMLAGQSGRGNSTSAAAATAAASAAATPRQAQAADASTAAGSAASAGSAAAASAGAGPQAPLHQSGSARVHRLQPEALRVVGSYLRDHTFGPPGSGWRSRGARTCLSALAIGGWSLVGPLLVYVLGPLAVLLIVSHSIAKALGRWGKRLHKRFSRRVAPGPATPAQTPRGGWPTPRATPAATTPGAAPLRVPLDAAAAASAAASTAATPRGPDASPAPTSRGAAAFNAATEEAAAASSSLGARLERWIGTVRLWAGLFLGLHTHVAAWAYCVPVAIFVGIVYGMGYQWGRDAVPYPWLFLAANATALAGVLLLALDWFFEMTAWEHAVCRYPYRVAVRAAARAAAEVKLQAQAAAEAKAAGRGGGGEEEAGRG